MCAIIDVGQGETCEDLEDVRSPIRTLLRAVTALLQDPASIRGDELLPRLGSKTPQRPTP